MTGFWKEEWRGVERVSGVVWRGGERVSGVGVSGVGVSAIDTLGFWSGFNSPG